MPPTPAPYDRRLPALRGPHAAPHCREPKSLYRGESETRDDDEQRRQGTTRLSPADTRALQDAVTETHERAMDDIGIAVWEVATSAAAQAVSYDRRDTPPVRIAGASTPVVYSDGGVVTVDDLRRLLTAELGDINRVEITGRGRRRNEVRWRAWVRGGMVLGSLVLHARYERDRVTSWAEIVIGLDVGAPEADPADAAAHRARKLIERLRLRPTMAVQEVVAELVRIVDEAEAEWECVPTPKD
jgi:hypothetical protein